MVHFILHLNRSRGYHGNHLHWILRTLRYTIQKGRCGTAWSRQSCRRPFRCGIRHRRWHGRSLDSKPFRTPRRLPRCGYNETAPRTSRPQLDDQALLSFVAFTDSPEPGEYWGEVAILCFSPEHEQAFTTFAGNVAQRLMEGIRPEVDLGEQGIKQILDSNGTWSPSKTVPLPTKKPGTVIMKGRRKMSERLIEQGRKGNKGCYIVSWIFILAVVALACSG
mgnify:CR=1 FL=1